MISQYRSASILAAKKLWTPVTLVHAGAKALAGSLGTLTCLSLLKQKWHADARGTSMKGVTICKDVEQSYRFFVDWITTFLLCMYVPCLSWTTLPMSQKANLTARQSSVTRILSQHQRKQNAFLYRDPITMILHTSLHDSMLSCCALA